MKGQSLKIIKFYHSIEIISLLSYALKLTGALVQQYYNFLL